MLEFCTKGCQKDGPVLGTVNVSGHILICPERNTKFNNPPAKELTKGCIPAFSAR